MRNIIWLIRGRLVLWKNHLFQVLFLLAVPFLSVLIYLFTSVQGNQAALTIGINDRDQATASRQLTTALRQQTAVKAIKTPAKIDDALTNQTVVAVVTIPAGYTRELKAGHYPQLRLRTLQRGATVKTITTQVTTAYATAASLTGLARSGVTTAQVTREFTAQATPIHFRQIDQQHAGKRLSLQILGFLLMMLLYQANMFGTRSVQEERRHKIYQRLMLTPLSSSQYFISTAIFAMLAMIFEVLLTTVVMVGIVKIDPGLPVGQLVGVLTWFGLLAVVWSLAVGVLSSGTSLAAGVQTVLITVTSLLSGSLIPLTVMPTFMQKIAMLTPQYWILNAIQALQAGHVETAWLSLGVESVFIIFCFSLATYGFNRRQHQEIYD